jgi:dihydrofolate reductase
VLCEIKRLCSKRDERECLMRKVVARIFDYSVDGVISEEGTEFFQYCRDLPDDPAQVARTLSFYEQADLHIMGRVHYQGMAQYFPTAVDHPYAAALLAARKIVFSSTLQTAGDLANSTINSGDLAEEIHKLKQDGDGYIAAHGGVRFWRSLMRLDLIDEYRVTVFPYLAVKGPRLFDDLEKPRQLGLVSSTAFGNGTLELAYRPHR